MPWSTFVGVLLNSESALPLAEGKSSQFFICLLDFIVKTAKE